MSDGNWIKGAVKHNGGLHESLHVPAGDIIPKSKIMKAEHADSPKVQKQARLAATLEHMRSRHGSGV